MISFFAYHRDPELRSRVNARIERLCRENQGRDADPDFGFVQAFAGGAHDLSLAHRESGFTVGLLRLGETVFDGLAAGEDAAFLLSLAQTARADAIVGDVPELFLEWLFEAAVAEHGLVRMKQSAATAGPLFEHLAIVSAPTPLEIKRAKLLAKQAKRRGLVLPSPEETFVKGAVDAALHNSGDQAGAAVRWIAALSDQSDATYRICAGKLLELIDAA